MSPERFRSKRPKIKHFLDWSKSFLSSSLDIDVFTYLTATILWTCMFGDKISTIFIEFP
jgi:hypothetical protein